MKHLVLVFILSLFCFTSFTYAEKAENDKPQLSKLLKDYILSLPDEKYIINTDREIYFINESIWFNIWSIDDITNIPVTRSGIIYLELIGNNGDPVIQQTLIVDKSTASGRVVVPSTTPSGIYYLRAYTNWQKNFGTESFGIKIIEIINPNEAPPNIHPKSPEIDISYFPEGGRLIYGINNKILVEAKFDNANFSALGNTNVIDQNGNIITTVSEISKGIGVFYLNPEKDKSYFVSNFAGPKLPLQIYEQGLNLSLSIESEILKVTVNGRIVPMGDSYYLVARNSGKIFFEKEIRFQNQPGQYDFPLRSLPEGLSDFAILKADSELISQRLFFKNYENSGISVDIIPEKPVFTTRDSVVLKIISTDYKKISVLSLSIRKKALMLPSLVNNLQADILLHSCTNDWDLFKQLELNSSKITNTDIINDYLISKSLTRNKWEDILSGRKKAILYAPEINTKIISGIASDPVSNEPITNDKLLMYFINQIPYLLMSNTNEQGRFRFTEPIKNYGKQEVLLQAEQSVNGLSAKFDWPYFEEYFPYKLNSFYYDTLSHSELDKAYVNWQINMIHNEKIENLNKRLTADQKSSLYGPPDGRYFLKDYVQLNDMSEVFKEIVEKVKIRKKDGKYLVYIQESISNQSIGDNPLLLYNGHVIDNIAPILNLPIQKINFIDVISDKFFIGENKFDGVLNIVPQDVLIRVDEPQNSYRYILDLFSEKTIFGTAEYRNNLSNPIPDLRNTMYWNPNIRLESPETSLSFFSGDDKGEFEIELKGMGTEGQIIQIKKTIEIR